MRSTLFVFLGMPHFKFTEYTPFNAPNDACQNKLNIECGFTVHLGLLGNDYVRIDLGNMRPDLKLKFKIMNIVGNFRGNVVDHPGTPFKG